MTRLPGALTTARDGLDEETVAGIERAIGEALDDLERMRESEGAALAGDAGRVAKSKLKCRD